MFNKIYSQKGLSLIQVLIALAILSILTLGFSTVLVNGLKGQKTLQVRSDVRMMSNYLELIFSKTESCTNAIAGGTIPNDATDKQNIVIKNPQDTANVLIETNGQFEGYKIKEVYLTEKTLLQPNYYLTKLVVKPELPTSEFTVGTLDHLKIEIPILVEVNPASPSSIISCGSENTPEYQCVSQGGNMSAGGTTGKKRCYHKGDLSGNVVWAQNLTNGATLSCAYPNSLDNPDTNVSIHTPSHCSTSNLPCCRPGFKRTRLGAIEWPAANRRETTFSCFYVGNGFCHQPGVNGCPCN